MARIPGTQRDDKLTGTSAADIIVGRAGNDRLLGGDGDDILKPGIGSDTMVGGRGNDRAVITDFLEATPDSFDGGAGNDTLDLSGIGALNYPLTWEYDIQSDSYFVERFGQPITLTFERVETIIATNEQDTFYLDGSRDDLTIYAGAENDTVGGGFGDDVIYGGTGDDSIGGGGGRDALYGQDGDDNLFIGFDGYGLLDGGRGNDTGGFLGKVDLAAGYAAGAGGRNVTIVGIENITASFFEEEGSARGNDGDNVISADSARHAGSLFGGGGRDEIIGSEYDDRLFGEDGNDTLTGGLGSDELTGGGGADLFRFVDDFFGIADGVDKIRDFQRDQRDRIDLSGVDAVPRTEEVTDAFTFIGTTAFSGDAGELRYELRGRNTYVQADTNGDRNADLEIQLNGEIRLAERDFILDSPETALRHDGPMTFSPHAPLSPLADGIMIQ